MPGITFFFRYVDLCLQLSSEFSSIYFKIFPFKVFALDSDDGNAVGKCDAFFFFKHI